MMEKSFLPPNHIKPNMTYLALAQMQLQNRQFQ